MNAEDYETFQQQALEIVEPDEDFDPNAPIEDGQQYLTHMLHERRQQPRVMVRPFFPQDNEKLKVTNNVVPQDEIFDLLTEQGELLQAFCKTSGWKQAIEKQFKTAKTTIKTRLDARDESDEERTPCVVSDEFEEWINFFKKTEPTIDILARFNQRGFEKIIENLCEWLRNRYEELKKCEESGDETTYNTAISVIENKSQNPKSNNVPAEQDDNNITSNETVDLESTDSWFGLWAYGAFAAIDSRVGPDVVGNVREMARLLILFRQRLDPKSQAANPFSLLVYLIVKVFRQLDLAVFV